MTDKTNRSIKRIVFATTTKFNGQASVPIETSQIKQIAGRAGRYRTAVQAAQEEISVNEPNSPEAKGAKESPAVSSAQNLGLVTTFHRAHLPMVQRAMGSEADPIMSAGIFPPSDILVRFAAYFPPSTPFGYILLRLHKVSLLHPRFHLCVLKDHLKIADTIEPVKNLTINDRILFCASPASMHEEAMVPVVRALAECVGNGSGGGILDIPIFNLRLLEKQVMVASKEYLGKLEFLHKALILYLWLSYRFAGVFNTQAMAFYVKKIVEERIQQVLAQVPVNTRTIREDLKPRVGRPGSKSEDPDCKSTFDRLLEDVKSFEPNHSPSIEENELGAGLFREDDEDDIVGETPDGPDIEIDPTIVGVPREQDALKRGIPP